MKLIRTAVLAACAAILACGSDDVPLDERIANVNVAGTIFSDAGFYGDGIVELRVVPLGSEGEAILENGMSFDATIASPAGVSAVVTRSECVRDRLRRRLVAGIVVDASTSMEAIDPADATGAAPGRRAAVNRVVDAMAAGDLAMLTDFSGRTATPLRDLVCVAASTAPEPPACDATSASLTGDTAALRNATSVMTVPRRIQGTPLYEACDQMNQILAAFSDRQAIVLLSDGVPHDDAKRAQCLDRARSANVSIFTIGFATSPSGVAALRDLAEATGGSYAPASDPAQLQRVLGGMGYSEGHCSVFLQLIGASGVAAGTPIAGTVTAGKVGARAAFEFLAPPRP
jgi:hypothetical protein